MANITYNTPDVTITEQGIEIPEVQAVLTGVLQDMNDAFGGNLNIENVATPQGFLSSEITYYMALKNAQLAFLSAMFDPSTSQGRWLDALAQIYFIQRKAATATVVTCQCVGVPGYTLPAGSLAISRRLWAMRFFLQTARWMSSSSARPWVLLIALSGLFRTSSGQ